MADEKNITAEELSMGLEGLGHKKIEVVCIETFKVYDFCFQSERRENNCFDLGGVTIPPGSTINCTILKTECQEIERSEPDEEGRANVSFSVTVKARVVITKPDHDHDNVSLTGHHHNDVIFEATKTFGFTKTVVLCAPVGTKTACNVINASCGPCLVMGDDVCCAFDLCIVIQSLAEVKLLVPSFGFCTPVSCEQVAPGPPFVCPPTLFPPQCPNNNKPCR